MVRVAAPISISRFQLRIAAAGGDPPLRRPTATSSQHRQVPLRAEASPGTPHPAEHRHRLLRSSPATLTSQTTSWPRAH